MKLDTCETEAIFEKLQKIMNLMPRNQQLELACYIEHCLREKKHLIAEAPTGVGKTFAYLIPAILFALKTKKKVIISTSGKTLQKQLADEDLPKLQQILPLVFSLGLGSENYICDLRMSQGFQLGLFGTSEDLSVLEKLAALRRANREATFLDCEFHVPKSLKQRICRDSHACVAKCHLKPQCAYLLTALKNRDAHIIVTNHYKTLHLIKNGSRNLDNVGAIVFDECHNLEETATAVFGERLESRDVVMAIKELYDERSRSGVLSKARLPHDQRDASSKAVRTVMERLYDLHEVAKNEDQNLSEADAESLKELQSSFMMLDNLLQKSKVDVLQLHAARLADFVTTIDTILKGEKGYVYWKQVTNRSWSFTATPLSVSDILRKKLFKSHKIATVHVSATVAVRKKMAFYRSRIGIIDAKEMIVQSTFNYRRQAAIYIPRNMPEPHGKGYLPAAIAEIGKLITHFKGKTLVLFTNYGAMNEAYDILSSTFPEFTFLRQQQGDSATNVLSNRFRKTDKAVLLGAAAFWEGINIPGPALQCVVIMKLPFGVPSDPVAVAHQEELEKRGQLPFFSYQVPRALIRFRQGVGRVIRTENDTGVVAILDARVLTKSYGKTFLKSLPDCPLIRDISGFPVK